MMRRTFTLTVDLEGAALSSKTWGADELARILEEKAARIRVNGTLDEGASAVMDINGNTVGTYVIEEVDR